MTLYQLDDLTPKLPEDGLYWVAPDANVIGNVTLSSGCSIWFGSTLRGDNEPIELDAGCNIQENSILHTDPGFPMRLGRNTTVGHRAILHGCTVGEGSLIGMGATILNGARIGRDCLIGACALITEGKEIPDRSLVMGTPGRVVRELKEAEIDGLQRTALGYQKRILRYRDGLVPIG